LAGENRIKNECPGDSILYEDKCYEISIDFADFEDSELNCLPELGENGAYDKRMIWSDSKNVFDFIQTVVFDRIREF